MADQAGKSGVETIAAQVVERLSADPKAKAFEILVLAALEGQEALRQALDEKATSQQRPKEPQQAKPPQAAYLKSITVEGFRGIGPKAILEIQPGPGLTLVVGRNGSGKSSFAEALELQLTGDTFRWSQRAKVWREGWRNLHHKTTSIETECLIEGKKGAAVISTRWADDGALYEATTAVQPHGETKTDLSALGWAGPLTTHRPFLSYNELGSMLDEGPSKLFDALAQILGLDGLVNSEKALADERKSRENGLKHCETQRTQLLEILKTTDDPRAKALGEALDKKDWVAQEVEALLAGERETTAQAEIEQLERLANLQGPTPETVKAIAQDLRRAAIQIEATKGTLAARSKDLADVLDQALHFHERHGDGACPVCGKKNALDPKWHQQKQEEVKALRDAAKDATEAQQKADAATRRVQQLPVPALEAKLEAPLEESLGQELKALADATRTWQAKVAPPLPEGEREGVREALVSLAIHLDSSITPLATALTNLKTKATTELAKREDTWRPVAEAIGQWLPAAKDARRQAEPTKSLKAAEAWLKQANEDLRNERFAPIKEKSQKIWNQLRMQSSVALEDIRLAGSSTRRNVLLDVTVDGVEGAALGVMSQGEQHALALSLFIPRATLPESPFRFIVIDDPVQSMDPARVDGLARVLEHAAQDRQVVVFTHDDRLPEAVRRLDVAATIVEVTRRESSVVETREAKDPVSRYMEDAFALAYTDNLPSQAARRVIPGFCRLAIEAACAEVIRKRRLAKGVKHAEVEQALEKANTRQFAALALFDDVARTADVMTRLSKERKDFADVFRLCQEGTHEEKAVDTVALVRGVENLTKWIQAQK